MLRPNVELIANNQRKNARQKTTEDRASAAAFCNNNVIRHANMVAQGAVQRGVPLN